MDGLAVIEVNQRSKQDEIMEYLKSNFKLKRFCVADIGKMGNKNIFHFIPKSISNKKLEIVVDDEIKNQTISNNLKLVSFELISRALDDPSTTEMRDKRLIIENHFSNEKVIPSCDSMKKALEMGGVFLEESSIDLLYI